MIVGSGPVFIPFNTAFDAATEADLLAFVTEQARKVFGPTAIVTIERPKDREEAHRVLLARILAEKPIEVFIENIRS